MTTRLRGQGALKRLARRPLALERFDRLRLRRRFLGGQLILCRGRLRSSRAHRLSTSRNGLRLPCRRHLRPSGIRRFALSGSRSRHRARVDECERVRFEGRSTVEALAGSHSRKTSRSPGFQGVTAKASWPLSLLSITSRGLGHLPCTDRSVTISYHTALLLVPVVEGGSGV